jgi:iron complex outermembrane receptor protein
VTDVGSSPHHEVVIQSLFSLPKNFEFDPTYRYVSALPALAIRSYSTMDIHLGWRIAGQVELSVVGQNLFQPVHYESGSSAGTNVGIKRGVYGKITWTREGR